MNTINPRHLLAITALLEGCSQKVAAERAGVSAMTLIRWQRTPDFQQTYRDAVRETFDVGIDRLQSVTKHAVSTLQRCLRSPRDGDKIKAAATLLSNALRAGELRDLTDRISALEQSQAQRGSRNEPTGPR
jgi:hypothetical protein